MVALLVVAGYLVIAIVAARFLYVYFYDSYYGMNDDTYKNDKSLTWASLWGSFWPVTLLFLALGSLFLLIAALITRETPGQRKERLAKLEKARALDCALKAEECGLPLTDEDKKLLEAYRKKGPTPAEQLSAKQLHEEMLKHRQNNLPPITYPSGSGLDWYFNR